MLDSQGEQSVMSDTAPAPVEAYRRLFERLRSTSAKCDAAARRCEYLNSRRSNMETPTK